MDSKYSFQEVVMYGIPTIRPVQLEVIRIGFQVIRFVQVVVICSGQLVLYK